MTPYERRRRKNKMQDINQNLQSPLVANKSLNLYVISANPPIPLLLNFSISTSLEGIQHKTATAKQVVSHMLPLPGPTAFIPTIKHQPCYLYTFALTPLIIEG